MESTYKNLLTKIPEGPIVLEDSYTAIEDMLKKVEEYVKVRTD